MIIGKIILAGALILLFFLCNKNNQTTDAKIITGKLQKWVQDYNRQNIPGLRSIFSKEPIGFSPNPPDKKYDDVKRSFEFGNDSTKITLALQIETVETNKNLGFVNGRWATVKKNDLSGKMDTLYKIRSCEIWKQEDDNEWRIIHWKSYVINK